MQKHNATLHVRISTADIGLLHEALGNFTVHPGLAITQRNIAYLYLAIITHRCIGIDVFSVAHGHRGEDRLSKPFEAVILHADGNGRCHRFGLSGSARYHRLRVDRHGYTSVSLPKSSWRPALGRS